MAITKLAHVALRVDDLNLAVDFYGRVLGMVVAHSREDRVYLAGGLTDTFDLELITSSAPGLDHFALTVSEANDLDQARAALSAARAEHCPLPEESDPGLADGVRFGLPSGVTMELVLESDPTMYHMSATIPPDNFRGIGPVPIDHVTLSTTDIQLDIDWLTTNLPLHLTDVFEPAPGHWVLGFVRARDRHHDIGYVHNRDAGSPPGMHHVAFEARSFDEIARACDLVAAMGMEIDTQPGRHDIGGQLYVYFQDPSGNRVELVVGMREINLAGEPRIHSSTRFDVWSAAVTPPW